MSSLEPIDINKSLICFELSKVKTQPHLQKVIMLTVMFLISESIYREGEDVVNNTAICIDEAWDLMSGGEKAMTAVSLIFSIFLVKPSPFCLLDEVDAPLDDANVGRFNELLREMSSESQFILITHNKKTMELNDMLYGVTMQEPGVSKAISVQLQ